MSKGRTKRLPSAWMEPDGTLHFIQSGGHLAFAARRTDMALDRETLEADYSDSFSPIQVLVQQGWVRVSPDGIELKRGQLPEAQLRALQRHFASCEEEVLYLDTLTRCIHMTPERFQRLRRLEVEPVR